MSHSKFIIAVNRKAPGPAQINAAGHIAIGLARRLEEADLELRHFQDRDGADAGVMTDHPLIIFTARNGGHLRSAHAAAVDAGVACIPFFDCMRHGVPQEQEDAIRSTVLEELDYVGVGMFGPDATLRELTRRFSLMKDEALV